jgi:hypothetical protein
VRRVAMGRGGVVWGIATVLAAFGCGSNGGGSLATAEGFGRQIGAAYAANSARCYGRTAADWSGDYCAPVANRRPASCPLEDYCATVCTPRIAIGAPCADAPTGCMLLGTCNAITNRCVAAGVLGKACGGYSLCVSSFCEATTDTCVPSKSVRGTQSPTDAIA